MQEDIEIFLASEIDRRLAAGSLKIKNKDLRSELLSDLKQKADGMILLSKLQLDYICGLRSDRAIKEAMNRSPSSMYATYDEILRQLCSKRPGDIETMKSILQWLIHCKVPLTLRQVAEIVSIRKGDQYLDESGIATDVWDLASCLGSLVTLHTEDTSGEIYTDLRGTQVTVMTLAHYSVEEYLISGKMDPELAMVFPMDPDSIHLQCAKLCLQYIAFDDFKCPIAGPV
ncbi:hypothetical protein GQ53DRAFT_823022 [Thozetella sp. PMI_491]|nr:hypothetical protein GQ53DRAFT_823022 [Thozetella sp. PMI_491]